MKTIGTNSIRVYHVDPDADHTACMEAFADAGWALHDPTALLLASVPRVLRALPAVARRTSSNPASYVYLAESIRDWPSQDELATTIGGAGWREVEWRNLLGGIVAIHRAYA